MASLDLRVLTGESEEMRALQAVLEAAPTYALRITGYPPGPSDAQSLFSILPPGKTYDDKFVYGIYEAGTMVGCADVIRGYPEAGIAWIGLLLIAEPYQGRNLGTRACERLEEIIRSWKGVDRVRLGVVRTNEAVLPFWRRRGFVETGEVRPYRYDHLVSETLILEKRLAVPSEK